MLKVGILSDTHGFLNPQLFTFFKDCDELWHAGDWGNIETVNQLTKFKPVKGVYGNIDGTEVRKTFGEASIFQVENLKVCIFHIGGYPGRYAPMTKQLLSLHQPDVLVCGHSHILKVMRDKTKNLMYFNPGAAGNSGFHQHCTAIRLKIDDKRLFDLEVWEHTRNQP